MAIPILKVADLDRALGFWTGTLAATVDFHNPGYAGVICAGSEVHLSSFDGAERGIVLFLVDDVDALFAALRARGWQPRHDRGPVYESPTDQSWGHRELYLDDPDGHGLRFAMRR